MHAKTKKRRTLVCTGELGPLLERLKRARTFTDAGANTKMAGTLFHRGGEPVGEFRKSWATACRLAGVDRLFHAFRRSALRNLIRSGVSQSVAMQISGHRTRAVFDRYNITDEDDIGRAFVSLEQTQRAKQQKKVVSIAQ